MARGAAPDPAAALPGGGGWALAAAAHGAAVARDDAGEDDPDLGEAVDPARDAGAVDEAAARGVAEVVAVAGHQVVGVPRELGGEVGHDRAHLAAAQRRRAHQHRLPERVPGAPPRHHLEDPAAGAVVRPVRVLHAVNCGSTQSSSAQGEEGGREGKGARGGCLVVSERALHAGVVDAEAQPPGVAVGGGDVVDVEEDGGRRRRRRRLARAALLPRWPHRRGGPRRGAHHSASPARLPSRRRPVLCLHGEFHK